jgi:hypothetical protein
VPGWQAARQRAGARARRPARRTPIWPGPSPTTAGTGCPPHTLQAGGPRPQAPACCHAHRDLAGGASSIRSRCPASAAADAGPRPVPARPRAGAGGAGPHRRPGSADHRPGNGRCRAAGPRKRPCSPRRGAQSCGSHSGGPARAWCRPGGSRANRLRPSAAAREPRPCPAGPPIIAAGIPAVAGVPTPTRRSRRAESGTAPPCMRWRGRARPRRAGWPVAWSSPRAAARRGQVPARGAGLPAPPAFPASPRVVPVSSGVSIITTARKHRARSCGQPFPVVPLSMEGSTESRQLSAFHPGYPRFYSQPAQRLPSVRRRTPQPPVPNARCYVAS